MRNSFQIVECDGMLTKGQVRGLCDKLPIELQTVEIRRPPSKSGSMYARSKITVSHQDAAVHFYPPDGRRVSNAIIEDQDFPLGPCSMIREFPDMYFCFRPKLKSFDIALLENPNARIELVFYKFPKNTKYGFTTEADF